MDRIIESRGRLPDFLILGAAKAGTTSLHRYLKSHPDVFMPEWKEPAFFSDSLAGGVKSFDEYHQLFAGSREARRVGEASVSYLADPDSPERIFKTLGPGVQLIAVLRNPVNMAYSNWSYQRLRGGEVLEFDEALAAEQNRLDHPELVSGWVRDVAYFERASYAEQLKRFYSVFQKDQLRVYLFEEFFSEGLPLYPDLCRYLGIDDSHVPDAKVYNAGGIVRYSWLRKVLDTRMTWKEPLKKVLPLSWREMITGTLRRFNRVPKARKPMDDRLRDQLEKRFAPSVRELEIILERDLSEVWF